jgi:hypothetical protein
MSTRSGVTAPRLCDRDRFEAILHRLVTGCSLGRRRHSRQGQRVHAAATPRRVAARRLFATLLAEAIAAYDRVPTRTQQTEPSLGGSGRCS